MRGFRPGRGFRRAKAKFEEQHNVQHEERMRRGRILFRQLRQLLGFPVPPVSESGAAPASPQNGQPAAATEDAI
jgi:hypothetical protein